MFLLPTCNPAAVEEESPALPLLFVSALCFMVAVIVAYCRTTCDDDDDDEMPRPAWAPAAEVKKDKAVPYVFVVKDKITGKFLVGTTMHPKNTEKWKPTHADIIMLTERERKDDETTFTKKLINTHGVDMVRGGPWTKEIITDDMLDDAIIIRRFNEDRCMRCGCPTHVVDRCTAAQKSKDEFPLSTHFP